MTRVNSGVIFEYFIRDYFEAQGYTVVRSAGSKGPMDITAFNEEECIIIQAKKESKKGRYDEDAESLRSVKVPEGWKKQFWVKDKKNGEIIIYDLTENNYGIQVFDLKDIKEVIKNGKG